MAWERPGARKPHREGRHSVDRPGTARPVGGVEIVGRDRHAGSGKRRHARRRREGAHHAHPSGDEGGDRWTQRRCVALGPQAHNPELQDAKAWYWPPEYLTRFRRATIYRRLYLPTLVTSTRRSCVVLNKQQNINRIKKPISATACWHVVCCVQDCEGCSKWRDPASLFGGWPSIRPACAPDMAVRDASTCVYPSSKTRHPAWPEE